MLGEIEDFEARCARFVETGPMDERPMRAEIIELCEAIDADIHSCKRMLRDINAGMARTNGMLLAILNAPKPEWQEREDAR